MHVTHLTRRKTRLPLLALSMAAGVSVVSASSVLAGPATVRGTVTGKRLRKPADIVVSLEAPGLKYEVPPTPVVIENVNFIFIPRVLVIVPGTTVRWVNGGPEPENVYSPEGRYNLGNLMVGESRDHRFDLPGEYTQLCNIHPDGLGYVVVRETPYFDVTDEAGAFEINGVAPGHYTLLAWSEKYDLVTLEIDVADGKTLAVTVRFGR